MKLPADTMPKEFYYAGGDTPISLMPYSDSHKYIREDLIEDIIHRRIKEAAPKKADKVHFYYEDRRTPCGRIVLRPGQTPGERGEISSSLGTTNPINVTCRICRGMLSGKWQDKGRDSAITQAEMRKAGIL